MAPANLLSTVGYLQFEAYALDATGSPITGLGPSDFTVKDGATAIPIAYLRQNPTDTPASVVIVIDASESMASKINPRSGDTVTKVHSALAKSFERFGRCDEIAIVVSGGKYASGFRPTDYEMPAALSDVTLLTGLTTDHSRPLRALGNIVASGPGNLSDAMGLGMRQFMAAYYPARVMVIVTDGLDARALSWSKQYVQAAKLHGFITKVIGIGHEQPGASSSPSSVRRTEALDIGIVTDFASSVHAPVMLAKPVNDDDGASLAQAFETIGQQIGNSYTIGVIAPEASSPGGNALSVSRANPVNGPVYANVAPITVAAEETSKRSSAQCLPRAPTPPSITSKPGYTQLRVSVLDSKGHPVQGLKESDFVVASNSKPLPVAYTYEDKQGVPTSVLVAIDVSASMAEKLEAAYPEIANVILGLNACDEVGLLAFGESPILVQPLTTDHFLTAWHVPSLSAYGTTGLYDAIIASAKLVVKGKYPNRTIVLVTDGVDTVSRASISDALKTLQENNVQVDVIGVGSTSKLPQVLGVLFGAPDAADRSVIERLAARTGGVDYIAPGGDPKEMAAAAAHVKTALGPGYDFGFTAPGELYELNISIVKHPEYSVGIISVPTASSLIHRHAQAAKH